MTNLSHESCDDSNNNDYDDDNDDDGCDENDDDTDGDDDCDDNDDIDIHVFPKPSHISQRIRPVPND